jgi:hypothetical protein
MAAAPDVEGGVNGPFRLDNLPLPGACSGALGMCVIPGRVRARGGWARDLAADLAELRTAGVAVIVTLVREKGPCPPPLSNPSPILAFCRYMSTGRNVTQRRRKKRKKNCNSPHNARRCEKHENTKKKKKKL